MTATPQEFDDIRPYSDSEVTPVVQRLINDREMVDTLLSIKHPVAARYFGWLLRPFVRRVLHKAFDDVHCVRDLQVLVGEGIQSMLDRYDTPFTVSGAEKLSPDQAYLFIGNHRDIAMDPAFVGFALDKFGLDTVRIAIGDNLLTKPFSSDLMRLNKSFIVRRSVTGRREKLSALTTLSRYIRHSITVDKASIWIAQREGRAKNGIDRSEPALIKMLSLSREKGGDFGEAIRELNIVPVAISYCLDPCDVDKAKELHAKATTGEYHKKPHEDLLSMYKGIVEDKGAVHLVFGEPLSGDLSTPEAVAAALDEQILRNYSLHPTNIIAWQALNGPDPRIDGLKAAISDVDWTAIERQLMARIQGQPEGVRQQFLAMYANPVNSRLDREATIAE